MVARRQCYRRVHRERKKIVVHVSVDAFEMCARDLSIRVTNEKEIYSSIMRIE